MVKISFILVKSNCHHIPYINYFYYYKVTNILSKIHVKSFVINKQQKATTIKKLEHG